MFTVLIAEKEHIDAIRKKNNIFFEPFLKNKELAFCCWNPSGQTLNEAVPELLDTVGRTKQWRAVIINNNSEEFMKNRNPFDFIDYSELNSLVSPSPLIDADDPGVEWLAGWETYFEAAALAKEKMYRTALSFPLQKLATWLCFKPEDFVLNDVDEKQSVFDWALNAIDNDEVKPSTRLEMLERNQYKRELRLKETIRREFVNDNYLHIAYPAEIHCISTRTTEKTFFDPNLFWNIPSDSEYSSFADRNMYFDKMRFLVFDLLEEEHRNYRTDYIRFLASVLIFVSNPVPISTMQARRLYALETETDDSPLCTLVTSYDKKLAATSEVIDNEIDKIRSEIPDELTDKVAESLFCTSNDIEVLLDEAYDTEKVFVKNDYGLSSNCPEDEHQKWTENYKKSQKELADIIKQQSRSVKKSVVQSHLSSEVIDININRLTPLQIDDVRDFTDAMENDMVAAIPPDFSDMSKYNKRMNDASAEVKKVIARRMTRTTTIVVGAICLGLYLICFLPFLFTNNTNPLIFSTSLTFCGIMIGLFALILFVALFFLRNSIKRAVKQFNDVINDVINDISTSLKQVSNYLSASCNVRRGHSVQNYSKKNVDEYTKSIRIRKKHQEDIRRRRACLLEDYEDYFAGKEYCDETMARPYDFDFDATVEYDYEAPFLAGDTRQIEFMSSGNFVTVPSSYVTKISVRMEGIYE